MSEGVCIDVFVIGLESVYDLIGDHIFLCFHYYMDKDDGSFKACVDTKKAAT